MKQIKLFLTAAVLLLQHQAQAFCGFYVAKADTKIFNNKSQVILVRDGERTVITMNNDFKGDVRDFAMVVPVPVVLQKQDVKVAEQILFDKLDAYSAPRLVEYYDNNPCQRRYYDKVPMAAMSKTVESNESLKEEPTAEREYKVKIEAKYSVGEYDIIVLSAKESNGLQRWLDDNGYKIPANAQEVLEPYIKSNTKFFVAKVNLDKHESYGDYTPLRPLQISFSSPKFMLPIRLGMANSTGTQDLIIYSFTKKGRVECSNYRTVKFPTGFKVPEFVQEKFGKFYADAFTRKWKREDRDVVFTEYAWDISGRNFQKCDPCVSDPPNGDDLREAGVWWLDNNNNNWGGTNYTSDVFFTRLHVRYDREHFPQDLVFNNTSDNSNYQARYVITHAAHGSFDCAEGKKYLRQVTERREEELRNLYAYAGWNPSRYDYYIDEYENKLDDDTKNYRRNTFNFGDADGNVNWLMIIGFVSLCFSVVAFKLRVK